MEKNPFAINFGTIPKQYIERDLVTEEIIEDLNSEEPSNHCFMLTGVRGSGKTVAMTSIEKELKADEDWIVIGINHEKDMLQSLVAKLYDTNEYMQKFISKGLNLSGFGIGINIDSVPPVADIESALEIILKEIKHKGKRLLVTVDEVSPTSYMKIFASTFQILIRQELPIFMIMAGLYENVHNLENEDSLTFLYRTPKFDMEPLNTTLIQQKYVHVLGVDSDMAFDMAVLTKGYAIAYQVLGKYMWESDVKALTDEVLVKFDAAMEKYVYLKLWSELSKTDKWYLSFIASKPSMDVSELLELTNKKKNEFSQYRARLRDKGIIDVSNHGIIKMKLPRFDVFVKMQIESDGIFN